MKKTQEIPWKRISAEGFAIVVSILLAFGIDAWWDERRERAEEQVLLTRLAAEFSINLERIELYIEGFSNIVDACSQLYEIVDNAMVNQEETAGLPAGWLRLSLIAPLYEANTPLLDALTKVGKLDVVDDSRVIEAVSEWERQLRDYTSMAERARCTSRFRAAARRSSRSYCIDRGKCLRTLEQIKVYENSSSASGGNAKYALVCE